jgi:hypothetical protein
LLPLLLLLLPLLLPLLLLSLPLLLLQPKQSRLQNQDRKNHLPVQALVLVQEPAQALAPLCLTCRRPSCKSRKESRLVCPQPWSCS